MSSGYAYTIHCSVIFFVQGALVGTLTSLAVMLWIGVGAYITKPTSWKAPVSVEGCNWNLTLREGLDNFTSMIDTSTAVLNNTPAIETVSQR